MAAVEVQAFLPGAGCVRRLPGIPGQHGIVPGKGVGIGQWTNQRQVVGGGAAQGCTAFGKVFFAELSGIGVYLLMAVILIWRPEGLMKRGAG